MARDGADTQTGVGVTDGRTIDDLDVESAAREGVTRAARLLGARKPATATVPVVFDPMVTSEFLDVVADMFSAEAVQKGRSLFADRLGDPVASALVSIVDDGRIPLGPSSSPIDDEGVPTGRTTLVDAGILRDFLRNTETAARDGESARSTGNAARSGYRSTPGVQPTNVYFDGDSSPAAELLGRAGTGLYVQQVSGIHSGVNAVSGEFSVGATGLWIRGGELAEPVRELTVSSTIVDMLRAIRALGDDRRFYATSGSAAGCTLLLDGMTVAGS
jgi:PmbA protein